MSFQRCFQGFVVALLVASIVATPVITPPSDSRASTFGGWDEQQVFLQGHGGSSPTWFADTLKLGDIERALTKVDDQGNSAITYKVDDGWPDPTTHANVVAYAKKGKTTLEKFEEETKWLTRIGDLLANGVYESHHWIVFRGVVDKVDLASTPWYWNNKLAGNYNKCIQEIQPKLDLVIAVVKDYVDKFQVLHMDLQPGNILWDKEAQHPSLIDWGIAKEAAHWSDEIQKAARAQLEFAYFKGATKICFQ
ncbi:Protein kinase domain-containing protein [Pleurotus pulmonarius]